MKKLLLLLLCVPLIGLGQECISGDCENGYGIFYYTDNWGLVDEYEGEFRNGLFTYYFTAKLLWSFQGSATSGFYEVMGS